MREYLTLMIDVLENGEDRKDRTGVGTRSVFSRHITVDLQNGFPAVTTKKLFWRGVVGELLWFLEGSTDERRLAELTYGQTRDHLRDRMTIWSANAKDFAEKNNKMFSTYENELGPIYGHQWREFGAGFTRVDQIREVINSLKNDPFSRRHLVSAWDPSTHSEVALPPCHLLFQFYLTNDKELCCQVYQRSADIVLGVPFNIASYALLTHIIARECQFGVGNLTITFGDIHIYHNHMEGIREQIQREPYQLPDLIIDSSFNLNDGLNIQFQLNDVNLFHLNNYKHHPKIDYDMAV